MATDVLKALMNPTNRLWSLPLLTAGAAVGVFVARAGQGGTPRMAIEAAVAGAAGFLIAAAWSSVDNAKAKVARPSMRAEDVMAAQQAKREVEGLRAEIRTLENGLHKYLEAKKGEGLKLRNAIIDLNNDVTRLKDESPVQQLKPQLEAIAEKFGELAGVRQAVGKLSVKMRRVEAIGQQVAEAEARVSSGIARADSTAEEEIISRLKAELQTIKGELSGELKRDLTTVVEQSVTEQAGKVEQKLDAAITAKANEASVAQSIELDDVVDRVYANLDDLIDGRVNALVKGLRRVSGVMQAVGDTQPAADVPAGRPGLRLVQAGASAANAAVSGPMPVAPVLSVVPNSAAMPVVDNSKLETLELRLSKMADTIDRLSSKIENIRFESAVQSSGSGAADRDDGIPSRFRKPAGIDVKAPENAVKGGCLAKLFQANLDLHKAAKAA